MKVEIDPIYVDTIPDILEDRKIYISEKFHISVHNCLCGCGDKVVMPLNHGEGFFKDNGWMLIKNVNGTISFAPSIGNFQSACKSHYIITKNIANFI